jgi:hypothetical protein
VDAKDANVENVGVVVKQRRGIIMCGTSGSNVQSAVTPGEEEERKRVVPGGGRAGKRGTKNEFRSQPANRR